jgi:GT2 family glycosyltransferase
VKKICVVIPMYGKAELTNRCIDYCRANARIEHDILVVDDGSPEPFKHMGVEVLRLEENRGFTNAVNQGILACYDRYEYIHLLNNDTEPQHNFLKLLYDVMEADPVIGIAGSARILETDSPHNIELHGMDLIRGYQLCTNGNIPNDIIFTHWVPLCSALIRYEMIQYIGLLDRRMKVWCSDNDYCIRANFNGWNVAVIPKSLVKHIHAATTNTVQGKYSVQADQQVLLEKMSGFQYADLMTKLPLDCESNTWGKIEFTVNKK